MAFDYLHGQRAEGKGSVHFIHSLFKDSLFSYSFNYPLYLLLTRYTNQHGWLQNCYATLQNNWLKEVRLAAGYAAGRLGECNTNFIAGMKMAPLSLVPGKGMERHWNGLPKQGKKVGHDSWWAGEAGGVLILGLPRGTGQAGW